MDHKHMPYNLNECLDLNAHRKGNNRRRLPQNSSVVLLACPISQVIPLTTRLSPTQGFVKTPWDTNFKPTSLFQLVRRPVSLENNEVTLAPPKYIGFIY